MDEFNKAEIEAALRVLEKHLRNLRKKCPRRAGIDGLDYREMTDNINKVADLIYLLDYV